MADESAEARHWTARAAIADGTASWKAEKVRPGLESALGSGCDNGMIALDGTHVRLVCDRVPHGWLPIPAGSPDGNSVRVGRVAITRNPW